jgi:ribosome-associated heat shock protein Hsp15
MYRDETPELPKDVVPRIAERDRGIGRPSKRDRRDIEKLRRG